MRKLFHLLVSVAVCSLMAEKIDDSIHYYLSFTSDASKVNSAGSLENQEIYESDEIVKITTMNNEHFVCKIPVVDEEDKKSIEYNGPRPDFLLETNLYNKQMCSFLFDVYWSYQVCHGRFVTQYHDEKSAFGTIGRTEFYLGNYHSGFPNKKDLVETLNPPKKRIENEEYPYYTVNYNKGTTCDVTGKPRVTDVVYICVENTQHKILSVTEVSSCHYEIIIMTDLLCQHPAYKLTEKKDHEIYCWNEDSTDNENAKPKTLQRLNDFHDSTFKREYSITNSEEIEDDDTLDEESLDQIEKVAKGAFKLAGEKRFKNKDTLANNPMVVEHTVNSILTGNDCIVGGQGWWKYEFCYGRHVVQFHEEPNGQRLEILLGTFDEVIHNAWVQQSSLTRGPTRIGDHVTQVQHLYSKGDICDETNAHRSAEVRIKCKTSDYSALAISISLSEPKTCQYLLEIDSERFCEPLQYADDMGMIKIEEIDQNAPRETRKRTKTDTYDDEGEEENDDSRLVAHTEL